MVRELAQRGVLAGERGGYVCRGDVADVVLALGFKPENMLIFPRRAET